MADVSSYVNQMNNLAQANNAWSAQQAQKQMDFQKMMSDTAHQREVADLKAAGLNPVLSAGGSGAASASGAMASADTSASDAIGALFQTVLSTDNARAVAEMNNSAAMLRQQQSDSAAMDRLLIQLQGKGIGSGSGGTGSSGAGNSGSASGYFGEGFFNWTDGFFNGLPDKGNTKLFGISLPNSAWKYLWNTLGTSLKDIVQDPNAQQYISGLLGNSSGDNNSGKTNVDYNDNDDPQAHHPHGSMVSLDTLREAANAAGSKGSRFDYWRAEEAYWRGVNEVRKQRAAMRK